MNKPASNKCTQFHPTTKLALYIRFSAHHSFDHTRHLEVLFEIVFRRQLAYAVPLRYLCKTYDIIRRQIWETNINYRTVVGAGPLRDHTNAF
jgi:hypothetical protein